MIHDFHDDNSHTEHLMFHCSASALPLRPSFLLFTLTGTLILSACGPDPVDPVASNPPMMQDDEEAIDFIAITGTNLQDPNTSPFCPFTQSCPPLPGEPTESLSSGTCEEKHFIANTDGSRTFVNESKRIHTLLAKLSELEDDHGVYEVTYENGKIKSYSYDPKSGSTSETSYTYTLGRLATSEVSVAGRVIDEQSFTYDDLGRVSTHFSKVLTQGNSYQRTSQVYQYSEDEERTRQLWDDLDVDNAISEPDRLSQAHTWNEDGLLESYAQFDVNGEQRESLDYTYEDGVITGIHRVTDTSTPLYTFTFNDEKTHLMSLTLGEGHTLLMERSEDQTLEQVTLKQGEETIYEVELSGACDRTAHTWIQMAEVIISESASE